MVHAVAESDHVERFPGTFGAFVFGEARVEGGEFGVLERGGAGEQVEALEDEADAAIANGGELFFGELGLSRQPSMFMKVDLPEPLAPMMATNSPRVMLTETPRRAWTLVSPRS
jgi:hypothetical protein